MMLDYRENLQKCHDYLKALEQERLKIQMFQRELPLCLQLVTQAIDTCKQQLSSATATTTTTTDCVNGQSECSEQTTSHDLAFEEFIPIKRSSQEDDDDDDEHESQDDSTQFNDIQNENSSSGKKSDWLRSVQLWNQSSDPTTTNQESNEMKKVGTVDLKRNGGAFLPFKKDKLVAGVTATTTTTTPIAHQAASVCSTDDADGVSGKGKEGGSKKSRRCWSPELHRRFLNALQQLGGSHVATPKQIRELMKVDGLTNDEVKSHLQKYRLHNRRPNQPVHPNAGNTQPPQLVVVGGIWMPPPEYAKLTMAAAAPAGIYAPVATAPTRVPTPPQSERRSDSPATSSSTHTTTTTTTTRD